MSYCNISPPPVRRVYCLDRNELSLPETLLMLSFLICLSLILFPLEKWLEKYLEIWRLYQRHRTLLQTWATTNMVWPSIPKACLSFRHKRNWWIFSGVFYLYLPSQFEPLVLSFTPLKRKHSWTIWICDKGNAMCLLPPR